jgi:hypothetical protein
MSQISALGFAWLSLFDLLPSSSTIASNPLFVVRLVESRQTTREERALPKYRYQLPSGLGRNPSTGNKRADAVAARHGQEQVGRMIGVMVEGHA